MLAASIILSLGVAAEPAHAQSVEVKARIEAAFEPITARRKKLLTCTVTVPQIVTKVGDFINLDRKHALEEMSKAGFDAAFIEAMRLKTDPDRLIEWEARVGDLIQYCADAIYILQNAISDPRYHDAVLESLAASP